MLGMEIRTKVADYVAQRIKALRAKGKEDGTPAYENVAVVRGNAMKYMANFFERAQVGFHVSGKFKVKKPANDSSTSSSRKSSSSTPTPTSNVALSPAESSPPTSSRNTHTI